MRRNAHQPLPLLAAPLPAGGRGRDPSRQRWEGEGAAPPSHPHPLGLTPFATSPARGAGEVKGKTPRLRERERLGPIARTMGG
jgi:hypothetical protein